MALLRVRALLPLLCIVCVFSWTDLPAQDDDGLPEKAVPAPVAITFTPPDLRGRIVLGIFDDAGKLVRTLDFPSGAPELKIDTNGYIASWDGRTQTGEPCPAGRYEARGYVVGEDVAVSGEAYHFNDWRAEDHLAVSEAKLRRWPDGAGVELRVAGKPIFAKITAEGELDWAVSPPAETDAGPAPELVPPPIAWTAGMDGSTWLIVADNGQNVVTQLSATGEAERGLRVPREEPQPVAIVELPGRQGILIHEAGESGVQRVRMLRRPESPSTTNEAGRAVSDWEVVFERTWRPCAQFGVQDGVLKPEAPADAAVAEMTVPLVENILMPDVRTLRIRVEARHPGSVLVSPEGLELLEISEEGNWERFALVPDGVAGATRLYQGDGNVVEEFAVNGLDRMAAFDAGDFLLAAPGQ